LNTLYDRIGGEQAFDKLASEFYKGVAEDPLLRPMYPEEDLGPAERRLRMFLEQYWGGPKTYQEERGHPRLRMRHSAFPIGPAARDAWLTHMRRAVDSLELAPADEAELWDYLERAAHAMLNQFSD
jgi:hemoglobin